MQSTAASSDSAGAKASSAVPRPGGDSTDAALRSGLRAIPATRLPAFDPSHTTRGRLWFIAFLVLSVGGAFEVVAIDPGLVDRVARVLAEPNGEVAVEALATWVASGGLHA